MVLGYLPKWSTSSFNRSFLHSQMDFVDVSKVDDLSRRRLAIFSPLINEISHVNPLDLDLFDQLVGVVTIPLSRAFCRFLPLSYDLH